MNTYKFNALCKSGQWKEFIFQAANFRQARVMLSEAIENN
jgi:hypothetical protein